MFIEQDCTITHEGKSYTAGGAVVTPERAIVYVSNFDEKRYINDGPSFRDW